MFSSAPIFHGIFLALGLIIPLGAQNVFVISQGATQPTFKRTLPVIITASLADTFLILLAVMGISLLLLELPHIKLLLVLCGIGFLFYIGWYTWINGPITMVKGSNNNWPLKKQVTFCLAVSLLNPHAILDTVGVIGIASMLYYGSDKLLFVLTCILMSWIWFVLIALFGKVIFYSEYIKTIQHKISAIIIWCCAVYLILIFFIFNRF